MKLVFAGADGPGWVDVLKKSGAKSFLSSFYSIGCGKKAPAVSDADGFFLLDSGGYSARVHGVDIDVKKYAEFLNKYHISYAFNLDVLDLRTSLNNFYYLNKNTNTYIMPVYHGPEWRDKKTRDLIDYYVDCFPFIALGGIAGKEVSEENTKRFLSFVFNRTRDKVMVHGLGTTRLPLLQKYPFFCVDSTSWMSMTRFASSKVYSKEMAKVRARKNRYMDNLVEDIKWWIKVEKDITRLWEKRGIVWPEPVFEDLMKKRKLITYEEWKEQNGTGNLLS